MPTPLRTCWVVLTLGAALAACGSDLTLPGGPPANPPAGPDPDDSPSQLFAIAGNGQEAQVGKRLHDPLVVRLVDASEHPVRGVAVEFRFNQDVPGAKVDPSTAETDEEGIASAEVRLGDTAGQHEVEARVASATDVRTTFRVTALAKGGKGGKGGKGDDEDDD